jgi:hypothetical protein
MALRSKVDESSNTTSCNLIPCQKGVGNVSLIKSIELIKQLKINNNLNSSISF